MSEEEEEEVEMSLWPENLQWGSLFSVDTDGGGHNPRI